jgi:hypothetical protein
MHVQELISKRIASLGEEAKETQILPSVEEYVAKNTVVVA